MMNKIKSLLFVSINKFFSVNISGVKIKKNQSNLVRAFLRLRSIDYSFEIKDEGLIRFDFNGYDLYAKSNDESFIMSITENSYNDEYNLNEIPIKNKIVLDIGSNIGDTALTFISKGAKIVYCLEPIKETYKILLENIHRNKLEKKIFPFNLGLGNNCSKLEIPIRLNASGGNSISYNEENKNKKTYNHITKVEQIDVDKLHKIIDSKIDIVKIDCEGCEYEIIKNNKFIEFFKPTYILIEYHRGGGEIKDWLTENNYKVISNHEKNTSVGVLIAILK